MKVQFHREAVKFVEKLNEPDKSDVINRFNGFVKRIDELNALPISEYNLKKLSGKWKGLKRLKFNNIRIIFKDDIPNSELFVYIIDFRGNLY